MFVNVKPGVQIQGLKPEALFGMIICAGVFQQIGQGFTVTSVSEGKHKENSLHYFGQAFDIRTRDLSGIAFTPQLVALRLREALGSEFDVAVEADHLHVEFDP